MLLLTDQQLLLVIGGGRSCDSHIPGDSETRTMLRYGVILVLIFPSLSSSRLGGEAGQVPHVTVGPYNPWNWGTPGLTRLRDPHQAQGTQTKTGYETNIIIDQVMIISL